MSILDRMRARLEDLAASTLPALSAPGEDKLAFSAEIPAGVFGSILKFNVSVENVVHGDGERVRVRAHVQTNLASVLRPMLAAPPPPPSMRSRKGAKPSLALAPIGLMGQIAQRAQSRVRRALANPTVQRIAESMLKNDINTWIEITASTASLDRGAHELIPRSEKLASLGIRPARREGPHVESWAGVTPTGTAQVSTLQLDKTSLPERLKKRLGDQPFSLAAMIVSTIDEK